jgi:hypothetical protein
VDKIPIVFSSYLADYTASHLVTHAIRNFTDTHSSSLCVVVSVSVKTDVHRPLVCFVSILTGKAHLYISAGRLFCNGLTIIVGVRHFICASASKFFQ